jgi:DNA-binding LytR/AlgR family response regulator
MVIDTYYCGEDLLTSKTVYDMIFLDQQMGELTGLDAAQNLREKNMNGAIVFMTAYPDFVYESFKVNAFRFLKKPLDQDKIYAVLDDYFKMFGHDYPILLRHEKAVVQVDTKDIVFLEAMNKHCMVHLPKERMYISKTMSAINGMLPQSHFFRVNRAFIVNLNYISKYGGGEISFKNGEKVRISRHYLQGFKKVYKEYSSVRNPKRPERRRKGMKR